MNCSNCGRDNLKSSKFCQFCGAQLPAGSLTGGELDQTSQPAISVPLANSASVAERPAPRAPAATPSYASAPISEMGAGGTALMNIWGPFAGYGTRGHHFSWLLDNKADSAEELHQAIGERYSSRKISSAHSRWELLRGKGIFVEERRFYFIRRGITTVALYIARFGRDLYISQVTYVKGPISTFRVLVLALMLLFQLYVVFSFMGLGAAANQINPFGNIEAAVIGILFQFCVIGPLAGLNVILLSLLFLYSLYKWLAERDFLAALRVPPNEFQIDDTVALEKSVEETVRESLDSIGIDSKLLTPAPERSYRRRLI